MTDGAAPRVGFSCLACGAQTRVETTRTIGRHVVRRWRVCPSCGHRFRTSERPVSAAPPDPNAVKVR